MNKNILYLQTYNKQHIKQYCKFIINFMYSHTTLNNHVQKAKVTSNLEPSHQYQPILQDKYCFKQPHLHYQSNLYQSAQNKNCKFPTHQVTFINSQFSQFRKKIDQLELRNIEALCKIHKVFSKKKNRLSSDTSSQLDQNSIQKNRYNQNKLKKQKTKHKQNLAKSSRFNQLISNELNPSSYQSYKSQFNNVQRQQFASYSHRLNNKNNKKQITKKPRTPQLNKDSTKIDNQIHCVYSQKINDLNKSLKIQSQKAQILYDQLKEKQVQNKQLKTKVISDRKFIKYFSQSVNQFFSQYVSKRLKVIESNLKKYDMKLKSICLITKDAQEHRKSRTLIRQTQKLRERSNSRRSSSRKTKKQLPNQTQENLNNKTIMLNNSRSYKIKKEQISSSLNQEIKKNEYKSPRLKELNQINFTKITENYQKIIDQKSVQIKNLQEKSKIYQNYTLLEKQAQQLKEKLKDAEEKIKYLQANSTKSIQSIKQFQGQQQLRLRQIIYQKEKEIKNMSIKVSQCQKLSKQLIKRNNQIEYYKGENQSLKQYLKAFQIKTEQLQKEKNNIVKSKINFEIQSQNIQRKNVTFIKELQIKQSKIQQLQKILNFSSKTNQIIRNQSILDESVSHQNSFLINNPNFIEDMRKQIHQLQQKYQQKQLQVVSLNKNIEKIKTENQIYKTQIKSFKEFQKQMKNSNLLATFNKTKKEAQLNLTFKKLSSAEKNEMYSFGQIDNKSSKSEESNKHQLLIDIESLSSLRQTNLLLSINSLKNTESNQNNQCDQQENTFKNKQNNLNEVLSNSDIVVDELYSEQDIIIQESPFQEEDEQQKQFKIGDKQQANLLQNQLQQCSKHIKQLQNQKLILETNFIQINANLNYMKEELQKNQQSLKKQKEGQVQLKKTLRYLQNKNRFLTQDNTVLKEQNNNLREIIQQIEKNQMQEKSNLRQNSKKVYENSNLSVSQFSLTNNRFKALFDLNNEKQTQSLLILKEKQQQIKQLQNLLKITEEMQQKSLQQYKKLLNNISGQINKKQKRVNTLIGQNQLLKGQNHKLKQKIIIIQNEYVQNVQGMISENNNQNQHKLINNEKLEEILQENQNLIKQKQKSQNLISNIYQKMHQQEQAIHELNLLLKSKNLQSQNLQTSVVQYKHHISFGQRQSQRNFARSRKGSIYKQYSNKITNEDQILLNDSYQQADKSRDQHNLNEQSKTQQNQAASRLSNLSLSYQQNLSFLFQKQHEQELKKKLTKMKLQRRDHIRLFDSTTRYIHHLKEELNRKNAKIKLLQRQAQIMRKSQFYVLKAPNMIQNYPAQQLQTNSNKKIQIQRDCQSQYGNDRGFNKYYTQKSELQKFKKTQNEFKLLIQQNRILQNQFQILQEQLQKAEQQQNSLINIKNLYKNEMNNQEKRFLRQINQLKEQIEKLKKKTHIEIQKGNNYLSKEEVSHIFTKILSKYENVKKMLQPLIEFSDYEQDILSDQSQQALKLINNINPVYLQNFQEELRLCENLIQTFQKIKSKDVQ